MPVSNGGPPITGPAPRPKPPPINPPRHPPSFRVPAPHRPPVPVTRSAPPPSPVVRPPSRPPSIPARSAHTRSPQASERAFLHSPAHIQAVLAVFRHQTDAVQAALARQAIRNPSPTGNLILNDLWGRAVANGTLPNLRAGTGKVISEQPFWESIAKDATGAVDWLKGHGLGSSTTSGPLNSEIARINNVPGTPADLAKQALGSLGALLPKNNTGGGGVTAGAVTAANKVPGAGQVVVNAGQDALNLPETALSTAGQVGADTLHGNWSQLAKDFYQAPLGMLEHPKTILEHPLFAYLMATGAIHGASRLIAAPVRAFASPESTAGRIVSTERPSVTLSGNLSHDRPAYSKSPTVKYLYQKPLDAATYKKLSTGETVPRSSVTRDTKTSAAIGREAGVSERVRRAGRTSVETPLARALTPHGESFAARNATKAAYGAKTALKYGSRQALIPGAGVLELIADGTIRRPDTVVEDLSKRRTVLVANRAHLTAKGDLAKNAEAIKAIDAALRDKKFLANPGPAFKAAAVNAKLYRPLEAQALKLGHYRDMTEENLLRRTLAHYANAHMGARVDPELGLVTDSPTGPVPLSLDAIKRHLKGPEGVGGRPLTFTSDKVISDLAKADRQAKYVHGRPMPEASPAKPNTLYAYSHGLARTGHEGVVNRTLYLRGVVDAIKNENRLAHKVVIKPEIGFQKDPAVLERYLSEHNITDLQPFNIARRVFFPQKSLDMAMEEGNVHPVEAQVEAMRRGFDITPRLDTSAKGGQWGLVDKQVVRTLQHLEHNISPDLVTRSFRGINNWFRTVVLSTSAKHVPGVTQESLIRMLTHGIGPRSMQAGGAVLKELKRQDPEAGARAEATFTGGQQAGMTIAAKTHFVSDNFKGTVLGPVLKGIEGFLKAPGAKQLVTAWKGWSNFVLGTTKHMIEQNVAKGYLGKQVLNGIGYADAAKLRGMTGAMSRLVGLHGAILRDAARGLVDERKINQLRSGIDQFGGKWTDLSPAGQRLLMYTPFGLWWWNSAKYIVRLPVDAPVKTGLFAAANLGTEKARRKEGLDPFAQGHLPKYMLGGIGLGNGNVLGQNYYSPSGTLNDPLETGQSMLTPWLTPMVLAALGDNWLGKPLTSPGNPHGYKEVTDQQKIQAILGSAGASFIPFFTKMEQIASGGASRYDVANSGWLPVFPPTKTPGKGIGAGLWDAFKPYREYKSHPKSSGNSLSSGSLSGGSLSGGGLSSGGLK